MDENSRSIVGFTMVSHALVHTYELSIPILVVIWLTQFSVTTAVLGTVVSVGYSLFGLGALPSGILTDRYGAKRLIALGLVGMGAAFLLLSFAQGVLTIALALAIWGVAASIHHPAALALISTGVDEQGTGFAYHGMAGNLGIAVGPLVTALLLLAFDWRLVTGLLVVPAILAAAYAFTADFDEMQAVNSTERVADGGQTLSLSSFVDDSRGLLTVGFGLALGIVMMNGLFYRGVLTFLPDILGQFLPPVTEYVRLFDPGSPLAEEFDLASYLYAGLLTIGIAGQYVGGKLTDRIPPSGGLATIFGALALVAILFVPAAQSGLGPLLAISVILGFLLFALQPMYQATIAGQTPAGKRGLSYGYTYLANFGIGAAGAGIAGFLLTRTDAGGTFLVLALIPAVGAFVSLALYKQGGGD